VKTPLIIPEGEGYQGKKGQEGERRGGREKGKQERIS
jgi:hypothetical protein